MRSPAYVAHLLMQGLLEASSWPQLSEDSFREEVSQRLNAVGFDLRSAAGYWLACSREAEAAEGVKKIFQLNEAEYAVLAALYLHLRFLPFHTQAPAKEGEPSVAPEDIERGFPAYTLETVRAILGRLRNLQFVTRYNERLYPGPYLAAIDEIVADERAKEAIRDFKLRAHLSRRLQDIEEQIDAAD